VGSGAIVSVGGGVVSVGVGAVVVPAVVVVSATTADARPPERAGV
jgi:hypothetical protein